jgi:hypothetical protein
MCSSCDAVRRLRCRTSNDLLKLLLKPLGLAHGLADEVSSNRAPLDLELWLWLCALGSGSRGRGSCGLSTARARVCRLPGLGLVSRLVSPTERLSGVEQHPSSNFSRPEAELPADTRQRTAKLPICFGAAKNRTSHASSLRIERWRHRLTQLEGAHHSEARRRTI